MGKSRERRALPLGLPQDLFKIVCQAEDWSEIRMLQNRPSARPDGLRAADPRNSPPMPLSVSFPSSDWPLTQLSYVFEQIVW
jgi:hypothetical protein